MAMQETTEVREHINEMEVRFHNEIEKSIENAQWFTDLKAEGVLKVQPKPLKDMEKSVRVAGGKTGTSMQVVYGYTQDYALKTVDSCCILNFASYTTPGGGYRWGSRAQEEGLCETSTLYNVLERLNTSVYRTQNAYRNEFHSLYADSVLYTPDIVFCDDKKEVKHSVITCAAPNARSARTEGFTEAEIEETMRKRIFSILMAVACTCPEKTLVLGAFGCGVFGNDAEFVAKTFVNYLRGEFATIFKKVIFVLPNKSGTDHNALVFKRIVNGE